MEIHIFLFIVVVDLLQSIINTTKDFNLLNLPLAIEIEFDFTIMSLNPSRPSFPPS